MIKSLLIVLISSLLLCVRGANVEWNCLALVMVNEYPTIGYVGTGTCVGTSLSMKVTKQSTGAILEESGNTWLLSFTTWIQAFTGDVISENYFKNESRVLYTDDGSGVRNSLVIQEDEVFYLAFKSAKWEDDFSQMVGTVYGWAALRMVDGGLVLEGSAVDLDGWTMVVGGGSAIPEPSCVLLALLGGALLVLRRKNLCCLRWSEK